MKLSQIDTNQNFIYNNEVYALDITGRDGSGKRAVFNVKTKERFMMPHNLEVELAQANISDVFVSFPIEDAEDVESLINLDEED